MLLNFLRSGKELAGYTDPRLRRGLAWSVAEAIFAFLPYPLIYIMIDRLLTGTLILDEVVALGIALFLVLIARLFCAHIATPALFRGAYAMMGQARLRIAAHLREVPLGWLSSQHSGALSATLTRDLQIIEELWSHSLGVFCGGLLVPALLSVFLLWMDWQLGLLMLTSLPIALAFLIGGQWVLMRQSDKLANVSAAVNTELLEYLQGMTVLRSLGQQEAYRVRLFHQFSRLRSAAIRLDVWPAPLVGGFGFAVEIGFAIAIGLGVQLLSTGQTTSNNILLFAILALPVYRQLYEVGLAFLLLRFADQALQRTRTLLAVRPMAQPATPQQPEHYDITFDAVKFCYPDSSTPTLQGLSFTLESDSLNALVGPSGAGKTTLLQLIARLWDVSEGSIRIGGVDLRDIGSQHLPRYVSMVFQDAQLFSGSILENLRAGDPNARREDIEQVARQAQAHEFISRLPLQYDTLLEENGSNLSGGERQRLSIARALLKDAPIILLDEATASIDATTERSIHQALSCLIQGRTVIVIAHKLNGIRHADRILVMAEGELVAQGDHAWLLGHSPLYAHLWAQERQD